MPGSKLGNFPSVAARNVEIKRLHDEEGATLSQLGQVFDLSIERCRQIVNAIDPNARRDDPLVIEEMAARPAPMPDVYGDMPAERSRQKSGVFGIDLLMLETLAKIQCTQSEAAAILRISPSTMSRALQRPRIFEAWERGRQAGRVSLRRQMWAAAQGTMKDGKTTYTSANVSAQQWLSKQDSWLGWTDKSDTKHGGTIRHEHVSIPADAELEKLSDDELARLAGEAVAAPTRH